MASNEVLLENRKKLLFIEEKNRPIFLKQKFCRYLYKIFMRLNSILKGIFETMSPLPKAQLQIPGDDFFYCK